MNATRIVLICVWVALMLWFLVYITVYSDTDLKPDQFFWSERNWKYTANLLFAGSLVCFHFVGKQWLKETR